MPRCRTSAALCGALLVCLSANALAKPKVKPGARRTPKTAKPAPPEKTAEPAEVELTPLVPPAPPVAPAPVETRTITAYPDPPERTPEEPAVSAAVAPPSSSAGQWRVAVQVGAVAPLSVLEAGVSTSLGVERSFGRDVPVRASASVGFERHVAQGARLFLGTPQPRGFDDAASETQTLVPVELGLVWEPWRGTTGALTVGAAWALLPTFTRGGALGVVRDESGLGQAASLELGYSHRFGAVEVRVRARWGLRTTSVGALSSVLELPWYQVLGGTAGLAWIL